ncbi:MAG: T9SS type A sorting domain-containing protein [Flavobacteriales bacterium]|nr:T9SS type A sorting domain-containing protein [Flavobacteriales bacterium]
MRSRAIIAAVIIALPCHAQVLTDAGAAISIVAGAQLTVKGDLLAKPGSLVSNGGAVDLTGDLINDSGGALFAPVPGTVILDGAAQSIGGTDVTALDALDLQCVTLTLQQDVIVGGMYAAPAGVLQLRDALLELNAHQLTITNAAATAITRISGQVISETDPLTGYGNVEWRIGNGTGPYVLPFGDGTSYLPVTLGISVPGTGAGSFVFATYPTDPFAAPNNRPLPTGLPSLVDLYGFENAPNVLDRFWPITAAGFITPPTASLTFSYRDSEWNSGNNLVLESALQAQHFDGLVWSQPPNGIVNSALNTVTTAPTTSFDLVWALVMSSSPLPVELLLFDAQAAGDVVRCRWVTASERSIQAYVVERSIDGERYAFVGAIDGTGDSNGQREYELIDPAPIVGLSYYRLRIADDDGTERFSDVVPIWFDGRGNTSDWRIWPTPTAGEVYVSGLQPGDGIEVVDATGRIVIGYQSAAAEVERFDLSHLPDGYYAVHIRGPLHEGLMPALKLTP